MKRPTFLTIFLVLIFLGHLFSLYSMAFETGRHVDNSQQHFPIFRLLISLANIVAVVMIWKWMKMGVYLLIGSFLVSSILNIMQYTDLLEFLGSALAMGLIYLAVRKVWQNFK